jgi:hypothetical protein
MRLPKGAQADGAVTVPNVTVSSATTEAVNANSLKAYVPTGSQVPAGGTTGQVLTKSSATDYATGWTTPITQAKLDEIEARNWFLN